MASRAGFTLIEMLVVLVIIGLMTSLAAPRIASRIDHLRYLSERRQIAQSLNELPRRVRLGGNPLTLTRLVGGETKADSPPALLQLPAGWLLTAEPPLTLSRLGSCTPSTLLLTPPEPNEAVLQLKVAAISCAVSIDHDA